MDKQERKEDSSGRRRFIRRLTTLGAAGGIATLLYGRVNEKPLIPQAQAPPTYVTVDAGVSGTGTTKLYSTTSLGAAFFAYATAGSGARLTYGVSGQSDSPFGIGVYGLAYAGSGAAYGMWGQSASQGGTGVGGWATAYSGTTHGVYGESDSADGIGVEGLVHGNSPSWGKFNAGVYGHSSALSGIGVLGSADSPGVVPIISAGCTGQTANLQEWFSDLLTPVAAVDKDGQLGLGTNTPLTPLHIKSASSNPAIRIENENNHVGAIIYCYSNGNIPFFSGRRARGTMASPSAVLADDTLMRYGGSGYGTSGFPGGNRAILEFRAAETWTDSAQGTYITFSTTSTGGSTTAKERMWITADGSILPPIDNVGSIGVAGQSWASIKGHIMNAGDLVFENGVRATEEGKGLAFVNDAGEKIAVLDREGNFYVKGRVVEGLPE